MILDIVLLILVSLAFIRGWKKGLLWAICSLLAVVLGIVIALKLSSELANYLFVQNLITSKYTMLFSFVILFLGTIYVFRLLVKFVEKILDKVFLGWVNNLSGGLLYAFFAVFIVSTFCWLSNQVGLLKPEMKQESKSYPYIENLSPKTIEFIQGYLPYCKDLLQKAKLHLEQVNPI